MVAAAPVQQPGRPAGGTRRAHAPHPVRERIRVAVRGVGEVLITLGLVLLLFCGYQLYWTDVLSARETTKQLNVLEEQFQQAPLIDNVKDIPALGELKKGQVFARMYAPRLGKELGQADPRGHRARATCTAASVTTCDTAMPGEIGNFAVAGHRTTNGHPLRNVDKFRAGDKIFVETKDAWYTYTVTVTNKIVDPQDGYYVVYPVPQEDGLNRQAEGGADDAHQLPPAVQRGGADHHARRADRHADARRRTAAGSAHQRDLIPRPTVAIPPRSRPLRYCASSRETVRRTPQFATVRRTRRQSPTTD